MRAVIKNLSNALRLFSNELDTTYYRAELDLFADDFDDLKIEQSTIKNELADCAGTSDPIHQQEIFTKGTK